MQTALKGNIKAFGRARVSLLAVFMGMVHSSVRSPVSSPSMAPVMRTRTKSPASTG